MFSTFHKRSSKTEDRGRVLVISKTEFEEGFYFIILIHLEIKTNDKVLEDGQRENQRLS